MVLKVTWGLSPLLNFSEINLKCQALSLSYRCEKNECFEIVWLLLNCHWVYGFNVNVNTQWMMTWSTCDTQTPVSSGKIAFTLFFGALFRKSRRLL